MANITAVQGISAVPNTNEGSVATRSLLIDATNTVPLKVGSPVYINTANGKLLGVPNGATDTQKVLGSVVRLYYATGDNANRTPAYVPATTDGFGAEVSYLPNQRYQATLDDAVTGVVVGQAFLITNEPSAPAIFDPIFGDSLSKRQLDASSKDATDGLYIVQEVVNQNYNSISEANCEVIVRINPANIQEL